MTTENTELVQRASSAMAIADNAKAGDNRGTENIDSSDVRLPFIAIAQKTSKAIDPTETGKFIEGLKFLDMYNSETRQNYGKGPLEFIPVVMRKRAALMKENGQLGEAVDWDDPRVTWEGAQEAGRDKPEGQRIYDWAVLLVPSMELVLVSFRSKSFGAGKSLNGFVKVRKPSFAGKYKLIVARDENAKGAFGKFELQPAGKPDDAQFEWAEQVYASISQANITSSEEEEPGDAIEGEEVGATAAQAQATAETTRKGDNIPF